MAYFNKFKGTSGWLSMWERTIRFRSMRNKQEVARRAKILDFWKKLAVLLREDGYPVSESYVERKFALGLTHFHTYPRSPKMNPFIERYRLLGSAALFCIQKAEGV